MQDYGRNFKGGHREMNNRILEEYFPHIKKLADKFGGLEKEDCLQEGLLGGLKAVRTYKTNKGKTLDQWVELCASNSIRKYLTNEKRWRQNNERVKRELRFRNEF